MHPWKMCMCPLEARKKQGSGRSPEILMVYWLVGLQYRVYELQVEKVPTKSGIPNGIWAARSFVKYW